MPGSVKSALGKLYKTVALRLHGDKKARQTYGSKDLAHYDTQILRHGWNPWHSEHTSDDAGDRDAAGNGGGKILPNHQRETT